MESRAPVKSPPASGRSDDDLVRAGSSAGRPSAARLGYFPVPIERIHISALDSISVYLRSHNPDGASRFTLYCADKSRFTDQHRWRLKQAGVQFIYLPMASQKKFREQMEKHLTTIAADPEMALSTKSDLIYETSLELMNDVLGEEDIAKSAPRLERVSRAVSTLVMSDSKAFSHLFAASQHDFYTATHMINVGTWMTALAYAMGTTDTNELAKICTAGMVHDVGKIFIPEAILNKPEKLTEDDWKQIYAHPIKGAQHLASQGINDDMILRVAREHHERMDGTGYPMGVKGEKMHLVSKICAVIESFDAMTAYRHFRKRARTIAEALEVLQQEAPAKYDPDVVKAWTGLLKKASSDGVLNEPVEKINAEDRVGRRAYERFSIDCAAVAHVLTKSEKSWEEGPAVTVRAHSLSRAGLGFLTQTSFENSAYLRIHLQGAGSLANRSLEGQVVRCRAYKDGWFEVGMQFCKPGHEDVTTARVQNAA